MVLSWTTTYIAFNASNNFFICNFLLQLIDIQGVGWGIAGIMCEAIAFRPSRQCEETLRVITARQGSGWEC